MSPQHFTTILIFFRPHGFNSHFTWSLADFLKMLPHVLTSLFIRPSQKGRTSPMSNAPSLHKIVNSGDLNRWTTANPLESFPARPWALILTIVVSDYYDAVRTERAPLFDWATDSPRLSSQPTTCAPEVSNATKYSRGLTMGIEASRCSLLEQRSCVCSAVNNIGF